MHKHREGISKVYNMIVWSIILILGINILTEGIAMIGLDNNTYNKKHSTWVSNIINYSLNNSMPVLKLVADEKKDSNFISDYLSSLFPIIEYTNRYEDRVDIEDREFQNNRYIKNSKYNMLFLKENKAPLNNNYYVTMILRGIEDTRHTNNIEYLAEMEQKGIYLGGGSGSISSSSSVLPSIIPIDIIKGEVYMEEDYHEYDRDAIAQTISNTSGEAFTLSQLKNLTYLYNNFYIVSEATEIDDRVFQPSEMISKDFSIEKESSKPQILIYHTHSQEAFIDSREGKEEDTIVGVGEYLSKILEEEYGYQVIHDTSKYDMMEGYIERNLAYNHASVGIRKILEENPSIEVIIDIHRDGNDRGMKRVTKIGGVDTAQIMLFNGLSRDHEGDITSLHNPYLKENLAFSLQLQLKGRELCPGLMYKNYLHAYRYNLHYRERSILAEVGTNYNTVSEAKSSMEYFAVLLDNILNKK